MKQFFRILLLGLIVSACHNNQRSNTQFMADDEVIPITQQSVVAPPPPPLSSQVIDNADKSTKQEKKNIKDGRISIRVEGLNKTKSSIDVLVKKSGGYYANESLTNSNRESIYRLEIRIPSISFEKFITEIEAGDGEILFKEIDARDITDQFIDLNVRLKNKKSYLKRYNELLNKANSISEILEIEEKIRGLEEEIESTTGRLKYLDDQVDYSTLDLTIIKQKAFKYSPVVRDKFYERIKQSLAKGWVYFVDFSLFMLKLWPFWIVLFLILYLWRRFKRIRKGK